MIEKILKAVFPPRCIGCGAFLESEDIPLCSSCHPKIIFLSTPFISTHLLKQYFDAAHSIAKFDSVWQDIVHGLKYNRRLDLVRPLSRFLASKIDYEYDLVAFVPLHAKRIKERGYNQAALLAKRLSKETGVKIDYNLLKRIVDNRPQVGFSAAERIQNVKGIFDMGAGSDINGKDIILIDDVMTTGATVNECARVLKKNGAGKVSVLTLARA